MIWAVVLAAGESKRMGEPKLLLPYARTTVIETVVENILASSIDRVLIVLGALPERIRSLLSRFAIETTENSNFREGMLSSAQWGLDRVPPDARAVLVFLGDQPWISPETIDRVIAEARTSGKGLVCPSFRGGGGHPLWIDLKYRDEIRGLSAEVGLREILARHPGDVARVAVGDPSVLLDLDTPEDYRSRT